MKPRIAITVGDFNGIGPEVTLRSVLHPSIRRVCVPILVGPRSVFGYWARRYNLSLRFSPFQPDTRIAEKGVAIVETSSITARSIRPGALSSLAGAAAGEAILKAVRMARDGTVAAIVTAPVSKQALHIAGIMYPGQTEMLQHLTRSRCAAMMLVSPAVRVGLVTIHLPIAQVSRALTADLVNDRIMVVHDALVRDWGIRQPRIAVLGLNPHAGEGGDIGKEEQRVLIPVIMRLRRAGKRIEGPFPADGFFAHYRRGSYDAVMAMYHDQGLIPIKMLSDGKAVNVTAGLTIVRTSPDHGTAFPLAGKGIADPGSTREAILLAVEIAGRRTHTRSAPR